MINMETYIDGITSIINQPDKAPWELTQNIDRIILDHISLLNDNFIVNNNIAIHKTAVIETNVTLKSPMIIGENCFVGANSYLRNGVFLMDNVRIGAGCEIKTSIICSDSAVAHFNFIGDSIIGCRVNFEAGSITANHYNEREDKTITVVHHSQKINTHVTKFGSLVGDDSKIGANAVLSPGTLLLPKSIVKRLELVEQSI
jgi:bifunctional N-acetylglucosamine-1-phosphate-uridyltransferase/glucosamine-1-phosphate-acetyltransferase GlmU-like protein